MVRRSKALTGRGNLNLGKCCVASPAKQSCMTLF